MLPLAEVGRPLFGSQWLALSAVLGGVTVFLAAVALLGRWLAATHPDAPVRALAPTTIVDVPQETSPTQAEIAVIAAVVAAMMGRSARVTSVVTVPVRPPSVEALMLQWSLEGRRQIYSSHKLR